MDEEWVPFLHMTIDSERYAVIVSAITSWPPRGGRSSMPDARWRIGDQGQPRRPGSCLHGPLAWRQGTDATMTSMTSFGTSQRYARLLPTRTDAETGSGRDRDRATTTSRMNPDTGND